MEGQAKNQYWESIPNFFFAWASNRISRLMPVNRSRLLPVNGSRFQVPGEPSPFHCPPPPAFKAKGPPDGQQVDQFQHLQRLLFRLAVWSASKSPAAGV